MDVFYFCLARCHQQLRALRADYILTVGVQREGLFPVRAPQFRWGRSVKSSKHFAGGSASRRVQDVTQNSGPFPPPPPLCSATLLLWFRQTYRWLCIECSRQNSFSFHLAAAPPCEGNKAPWPLSGVIAAASRGIRLILRLRSLPLLLLRGDVTAPSSALAFPPLSFR